MKVVIIGAGQTGRGFVAPIFYKNGFEITFLDKKCDLIETLNEKRKYTVNYFGGENYDVVIDRYLAFSVQDPKAVTAIAEADIVTTSVFVQNIPELGPLLVKAIAQRNTSRNKLVVITVENSINAPDMLKEYDIDADISAGVIFCTSVNKETLDITSEYGLMLPVDGEKISHKFVIDGMPLIENFDTLIKRKIYTYNFMSAVISYLGSYKKYQFLDEASLDEEIINFLKELEKPHNLVMSKYFQVSFENQIDFWNSAYRKFSNPEIKDPIARNAQQALRKLGQNERLLFPMKIVDQMGEEVWPYVVLIASALYYALDKEEATWEEIKKFIAEMEVSNTQREGITSVLSKLRKQYQLHDLCTQEVLYSM